MSDAPHLEFGKFGEKLATREMLANGYLILAANWRFGRLEIDLICEKNGQIVFVEVKSRKSFAAGGAIGAVTPAKIRNITRAAQAWLAETGSWEKPCRFDVICVTSAMGRYRLERYRDVIKLDRSLDCGDPAWEYR